MRWIPTSIQVPKTGSPVLGYIVDGPLTLGGLEPMVDIVHHFEQGWVQSCFEDGCVDDRIVTVSHWMRLPDPPELNEVD